MANNLTENELDHVIAEVEEQFSVIYRRIRSMWKEAAAGIHPNLQAVGYKILSTIVRLGETNAHALADMFEADKSIISRQVRMLEEADLVISKPDASDGRARVLSPTPAAIERVGAVRIQQENRLRDILRSRPDDEVRAFAAMLHLVSGA